MPLVTSGKLLPAPLVERLVSMTSRQLDERPLGQLLLCVGAPDNDDGTFLADLEKSVMRGRDAAPDSGGFLATTELPALGIDPSLESPDADAVELFSLLAAAPHCLVPLLEALSEKHGPKTTTFTLGRAPTSDIVLSDSSVSSRHAEVTLESGGIRIEDLGSKNGTWLGGQQLARGEARWLQPMDRVTLGRVHGFFCLPRALRAVLRQDLRRMF